MRQADIETKFAMTMKEALLVLADSLERQMTHGLTEAERDQLSGLLMKILE